MSVLDREIVKAPFAVVDVETTGLSPRHDRIVELAIVVLRPGEEPQIVLDSLVRPERPMAATEIHGIVDADVADAPTFGELAPSILAALANRVACSHSAAFALSFLEFELERCGRTFSAPHLCTMLLPRALDPKLPHLTLARACEERRVDLTGPHSAARDALAIAKVLRDQLRLLRSRGIRTFGDLVREAIGGYAFVESLRRPLLPAAPAIHRAGALRPRAGRAAPGRKSNVAEYLEAVLDVAADLRLDDAELRDLRGLPEQLALSDDEVRAVHAKVFWAMLGRYVEDARIDELEVAHLRGLRQLLVQLGWSPGDEVGPAAGAGPGT